MLSSFILPCFVSCLLLAAAPQLALAQTGSACGDPHFTGLDGSSFDYNEPGEHLILKDGAGYAMYATLTYFRDPKVDASTWMTSVRLESPTGHHVSVALDAHKAVTVLLDGVQVPAGSTETTTKADGSTDLVVHPDLKGRETKVVRVTTPAWELEIERPKHEPFFDFGVILTQPLKLPVTGVLGATYKAGSVTGSSSKTHRRRMLGIAGSHRFPVTAGRQLQQSTCPCFQFACGSGCCLKDTETCSPQGTCQPIVPVTDDISTCTSSEKGFVWKFSYKSNTYLNTGVSGKKCVNINGGTCNNCHGNCCADDGYCPTSACPANELGPDSSKANCVYDAKKQTVTRGPCAVADKGKNTYYAFCNYDEYGPCNGRNHCLGRVRCRRSAGGGIGNCPSDIADYDGTDCFKDGNSDNFKICADASGCGSAY